MTLKRRLEQLEQSAQRHAIREAGRFESSQRDLCCPLPPETTQAETDEALRLLTLGKKALPNQGPLLAFRDYCIRLHKKYGGPFAGEELSNALT